MAATAATSQVRQTLNPLRVRGHIRARESMHTAHSPTSSPSLPQQSSSSSPTEFCTSYFFSGPSRPFDVSDSPAAPTLSGDPPRHVSTTNSSPSVQAKSGPAPILFDGPSRPRHIIPIAQQYLDDIKTAGRGPF
ncbi:hypothetical protein GLOTRDRAFT_132559 [Gloeophyllum trabeum ATCC 11539]|uniref:Uncharacterized protein n=1 Tax=Gloeophyllum trabeum (strain ATCC 11539 / FP-39264 / Madison 617) TaxID=670483 RepID=S7PVT4_GLOTA|nr:uncharacterized protein GLOTRDRAFT_132559 [Gloeophyllum trabeum ATCC 11539]EPQ51741.1 hypothetical protein GLOTRDRAFT_132559 [Gloeophyllum trabeum ATCC 11539]